MAAEMAVHRAGKEHAAGAALPARRPQTQHQQRQPAGQHAQDRASGSGIGRDGDGHEPMVSEGRPQSNPDRAERGREEQPAGLAAWQVRSPSPRTTVQSEKRSHAAAEPFRTPRCPAQAVRGRSCPDGWD